MSSLGPTNRSIIGGGGDGGGGEGSGGLGGGDGSGGEAGGNTHPLVYGAVAVASAGSGAPTTADSEHVASGPQSGSSGDWVEQVTSCVPAPSSCWSTLPQLLVIRRP
eukprot:scaffold20761_cov70-Phaeocystis_antarctica.AAC.1